MSPRSGVPRQPSPSSDPPQQAATDEARRAVEQPPEPAAMPRHGTDPQTTNDQNGLASPRRRRPSAGTAAPAGSVFSSIADLTARWSCARSTVYAAIREMERSGYLKRLFLGRVQRIAMESIEEFERLHAQRPGEVVSRLRQVAPRPKRLPKTATAPLRSMLRPERIRTMRAYTRSLG